MSNGLWKERSSIFRWAWRRPRSRRCLAWHRGPPGAKGSLCACCSAVACGCQGPHFNVPGYILFVVRRPDQGKAYFLLLPSGEAEGFLPPPPPIEPHTGLEKVLVQIDDFQLTLPDLAPGTSVRHFDPELGEWTAWDPANDAWKANWNGILYHVDASGERVREAGKGTPVRLWQQLLGAYLTEEKEFEGQKIDVPAGDPENPVIQRKLEDARVHNPTADAFEAAMRGAMEQFEASPFFKRDTNYEYDRMLGAAFEEGTTIYSKSGKAEDADPSEQRARQVRGAIVQDMIADLRDWADGRLLPEDVAESVAFQMGLVFDVEVPDGKVPEWLEGRGVLPTITVRQEPNGMTLEAAPG